MTRAEKASIAYQLVAHGPRVIGGGAILSEDDYKFWNINYDFKAGYEQAEKELELTWEDIRIISRILDIMVDDDVKGKIPEEWGDEEYYEEVLRRFNKKKEK